jgi:hypothetical protein
MKTADELPEKISASQFRDGLPQSPWDQGPTTVPSGGSKGGGERFPAAGVPGGEQISLAELAATANNTRYDGVGVVKPGGERHVATAYQGAGQGEMPTTFPNKETSLPREVSGGSWSTGAAGGGDEPHPSGVVEWRGSEPKKPA